MHNIKEGLEKLPHAANPHIVMHDLHVLFSQLISSHFIFAPVAIAIRMEAIATRVEAIAIRVEAIGGGHRY